MKNFVFVICTVLGFASPTFAVEGEAGTGPDLAQCLADCDKNQSTTTSESDKCKGRCNAGVYSASQQPVAAQPTVVITEPAHVKAPVVAKPKKQRTAPAKPPAPVTTVNDASMKKETAPAEASVSKSSTSTAAPAA